jgi:hypothetical protein
MMCSSSAATMAFGVRLLFMNIFREKGWSANG